MGFGSWGTSTTSGVAGNWDQSRGQSTMPTWQSPNENSRCWRLGAQPWWAVLCVCCHTSLRGKTAPSPVALGEETGSSVLELAWTLCPSSFGWSISLVKASSEWNLPRVQAKSNCFPICLYFFCKTHTQTILANSRQCRAVLEASYWLFRGSFYLTGHSNLRRPFPVLVYRGCQNKLPQTR